MGDLGNPKVIVFAAALLPQFIDPTRSQWPQALVMAATMCAIDVATMSGYALLAGSLRPRLSSPRLIGVQNRAFGGVFIAAGGWLALSRH